MSASCASLAQPSADSISIYTINGNVDYAARISPGELNKMAEVKIESKNAIYIENILKGARALKCNVIKNYKFEIDAQMLIEIKIKNNVIQTFASNGRYLYDLNKHTECVITADYLKVLDPIAFSIGK